MGSGSCGRFLAGYWARGMSGPGRPSTRGGILAQMLGLIAKEKKSLKDVMLSLPGTSLCHGENGHHRCLLPLPPWNRSLRFHRGAAKLWKWSLEGPGEAGGAGLPYLSTGRHQH